MIELARLIVLDIQPTTECEITLKCAREMKTLTTLLNHLASLAECSFMN